MPERIELDLALAGVALARNWLVGDRATVGRILAEVRRIAVAPSGDSFEAPHRTLSEGYREWSSTYDGPGNPIIQLEAPTVEAIFAEVEPGAALDAACGTGRHAAALDRLGHRVIGVDSSAAMLDRARARVPAADFRHGELESLPLESGTIDLAVCALALTHFADPGRAIAELARVVRPGGRVIISDVHPCFVALGTQAFYRDDSGRAAYVSNSVHWHGVYLSSFRAAGLSLRACRDVLYRRQEIDLWADGMAVSAEVVREALEGLPAIIVWDLER